MKIGRITACVQVRKDFGKCFDFYTEKLGLVPIHGDRNGPHTTFANCKDGEPFFAITEATYNDEGRSESSGALAAVFHTTEFDAVYKEWAEAGVEFIDKQVMSGEGWSFNIAIFSDTEGNPLSLEDGGV